MSADAKWLLLEGLIPLWGAAILYLLWGGCRYVVAPNKSVFKHDLSAAFDPVGWLYGAAVIAVQAAVRCVDIANSRVTLWFCVCAAATCLLVLIAAMTERAGNAGWQPPATLRVASIVLSLVILYAGYWVAGAFAATPPGAPK